LRLTVNGMRDVFARADRLPRRGAPGEALHHAPRLRRGNRHPDRFALDHPDRPVSLVDPGNDDVVVGDELFALEKEVIILVVVASPRMIVAGESLDCALRLPE
jgi:hypothetical protein